MNAALFSGIGIGIGTAVLVKGAIDAGSLDNLLPYLLVAAVTAWGLMTIVHMARRLKE